MKARKAKGNKRIGHCLSIIKGNKKTFNYLSIIKRNKRPGHYFLLFLISYVKKKIGLIKGKAKEVNLLSIEE